MANLTLRKQDRLYLRKSVSDLFSSGKSMMYYPFRVIYYFTEDGGYPLSWMVSVPKKHIKRAVHRNLLKRRIREIYRCSKPILFDTLQENGKTLHVAFIYVAKSVLLSKDIQPKVKLIIDELTRLAKKST